MNKIAIFGSSGHAVDIADIAIDNGYSEIIFLTHDVGVDTLHGFPVKMDVAELVVELHDDGYHFAIGVGEPRIRDKIFSNYPNLHYPTLVHSSVTVGNFQDGSLKKCRGTIIAAGSRITNNVTIGDFCFLGVNVVVGHDCIIENFVSLMPATCISGSVHIKKGAYIGCNASIRQGSREKHLSIGSFSIVGMGAVVLTDVSANHIALGVPASCSPN